MPLPAGYVLDNAPPSSGPPAGYVLDKNYSPGAPSSGDSKPSLTSDFAKYSPVGVVKSMADALQQLGSGHNPLKGTAEANAKLLDKAKQSFHEGDYTGAAAHFLNYLVPGGAAMEDAGEDFQKGDYAHGLAKTAGIASTAVAGAKAPQILETAGNVADAAPNVAQAVKAGAQAAAPDVVKGLGKVATGEALAKLPGMEYPARIAVGYPGARQVGRGITTGMDAAREAFYRARGEQPPEVTAQAPQAAATPAPAPPAPEAVAGPDAALLDDLSQSLAKKPFAKLNAQQQETVRGIAARGSTKASPSNVVPIRPPAAEAVPGATANPPQSTAPVSGPQLDPAVIQQNLADLMRDPESVAHPKVQEWVRQKASNEAPAKAVADGMYASGDQNPKVAGAVYEAAGRSAKASSLAQMLYDEGLDSGSVGKWSAEQFNKQAANRGMTKFSRESTAETMFRLKRLEAAAKSTTGATQ